MAVAFEKEILNNQNLRVVSSLERSFNNNNLNIVAPQKETKVTPKALPKKKENVKVNSKLALTVFFLFVAQSLVYFHYVQVESKANKMQSEIISMSEMNYKLKSELSEIKELKFVEKRAEKINMLSSRDTKYTYILVPQKISKADETVSQKIFNTNKALNHLVGY